MPAGLKKNDSMFSVRETPWHGLGVVLKKAPKTIEEAIKAAELDWEVEQAPVFCEIDKKRVPLKGFVANIRSDTKDTLGVVSKRYKPVQNLQAFSWLAEIFGSEMHFETAGSLMEGRRVWVMMKLPKFINVAGDPIGQYAFISNSHDGHGSVMTAMTPVRIVCQNTLTCAVALAKGKKASRTYRLKHLGDMERKIAEARTVLQVTIDYYAALKEVGDGLGKAKVTETKATSLLKTLFPVDDSLSERKTENLEIARSRVMGIFKGEGAKGDTRGNAGGSYWGLYNAIVEYSDWERGEAKEGGRFQRSLDDPDAFKKKAWAVVLDSTGIKTGSKNKALAKI